VTKTGGLVPVRDTEKTLTRNKHISAVALVVALLALVAALGGGSYAAKLITGKDIKNHSIASKDVKKNAIKSNLVKNSSLTGKDVKDGSLGAGDLAAGAADDKVTALRVTATSGADVAAAQAAAPEHVLFSKAPFTVYAKCFTDPSGPDTYAVAYIRTATNGALLDSDDSSYDGTPTFLNTDTLEDDRALQSTNPGAPNSASLFGQASSFGAFGADGTAISGLLAVGAKNGTLPGGDGAWGAGDACVFSGNIHGS
jgi:hypothetical protein